MIMVSKMPVNLKYENINLGHKEENKPKKRNIEKELLEYKKHMINKHNIYSDECKCLKLK